MPFPLQWVPLFQIYGVHYSLIALIWILLVKPNEQLCSLDVYSLQRKTICHSQHPYCTTVAR